MQIITPTLSGSTTDTKNISAITRNTQVNVILLRNEQTNIEYSFTNVVTDQLNFIVTEGSYYDDFDLNYETSELLFSEGEDYQITMFSVLDEVLFKGKLFVTEQLPSIQQDNGKYTINKGEYNQFNSGDNNDFIVLD